MSAPAGGDWTCAVCGEHHHGLALAIGADAPWDWYEASEAQRQAGELTDDVCFLPGEEPGTLTRYFLRGHIELPLWEPVEGETTFAWSVWVSLSGESLALVFEHWDDPDREALPPLFGWLCSALPYEPTTLGLRTQVHSRAPGLVPLVEVEPTVHPLAQEQARGIPVHRVAELNAAVLRELE